MSMNWLTDAEPAPKILVLPPGAVDLGEAEAAIELWEHYSRKTLDETQRLVVQVMMAQTADARWAAATTGREMPRQNGKGDEIEVVELWGLVQRAEAILHTIHDAVLLASQTQQRMLGVLEGHADLRRLIKRKWQGTGQQMIELRNGGVIWYRTRTGGGGRGVDDIDRLVVDEAQHATEEQLAAVSPTGFANKNSQLNAMGTSGLEGISKWWWAVRLRALSADPGRFGYVGHTAETVYVDGDGMVVQEPVDASDRSLWAPVNPVVASGRGGGMEFLEEQFRNLPDTFAQEHLGVWCPPPLTDDAERWSLLPRAVYEEAEKRRPLLDPVTLSVEVSPTFDRACIVAAGDTASGEGFELIEDRPGTDWLVSRLVEIDAAQGTRGVVVDQRSPAAAFTEDIEAAGLTVHQPKAGEWVAGCGSWFVGVGSGAVTCWPSERMAAAVAVAAKRQSGDAWVVDRRTGEWVGPVCAAVGALWGHRRPVDEKAGVSAYEAHGLETVR